MLPTHKTDVHQQPFDARMRVCEERLTLKVNHIKAPSVDGVATQLVKVAEQHLLDGHKVEGVGAVDADDLET